VVDEIREEVQAVGALAQATAEEDREANIAQMRAALEQDGVELVHIRRRAQRV